MRTLLISCGLSLIPLVAAAEPADLPNANLPGNSPTLPNSNLPGSVTDDHPIQLPNTDATPPVYWTPGFWLYQPAPNAPRINLTLPTPTEQEDATAELQRELDEAREEAEAARQEADQAREDSVRANFDAAPLLRRLLTPAPEQEASQAPSGGTP